MNEIALTGCRVSPLSSYLTALAVLRLVSEQADRSARGAWRDDIFILRTSLSRDELTTFFLERYAPSPVTAPWNGGSGYFPTDNSTSLDTIAASASPRFAAMRHTIAAAKTCLQRLGLDAKPGKEKNSKQDLLLSLRNSLPDEAVTWMDAAIVMTEGGATYPPILGTGGNDGRLEFTNNFMQRLLDIIQPDGTPTRSSASLFAAAVFDDVTNQLSSRGVIGQFNPAAAGGANATTGFDSGSFVNAWEFVLMIEGALAFSSVASKRIETNTRGGLSSPFVVKSTSAGYGSAAKDEDSRDEMWLPIWDNFASAGEVMGMLGEGRARVGRRAARSGLDFARAVASLGIDRGIREFQRIGIQQRNGLSYFAVPLGRFKVVRNPDIDLLRSIDGWIDKVTSDSTKDASAHVASAVTALERAIIRMSQQRGAESTQAVLIAIGRVERAIALSSRRGDHPPQPIPPLNEKWRHATQTDDPEWRLANALTSVTVGDARRQPRIGPVRAALEPVDPFNLDWIPTTPDHVAEGAVVEMLHLLVHRWLLLFEGTNGDKTWAVKSLNAARLDDINAFLAGHIDEARLYDLIRGLMLVNVGRVSQARNKTVAVPAAYGALRLCFAPPNFDNHQIALEPGLFRSARAGKQDAISNSLRRLKVSGLVPKISTIATEPQHIKRAAASLAFPLDFADYLRLKHRLIISNESPTKTEENNEL